jgi:protein-L-isoaspartate(D-aspartate) O-methyltransferase
MPRRPGGLNGRSGDANCLLQIIQELCMTDFAAARKKMVENQLQTSGITDRRLLTVMARVPREIFVPEVRRDLAYIDEAQLVPASDGTPRYIAPPAPFAKLVQLAGVNDGDRVLDLGCASGYSAAVLGGLAREVVAVESDAGLVATAQANLASLGFDNVTVIEGPVAAGAPRHGQFDVILLEGAAAEAPRQLFGQLAEDGRLVVLEKQDSAAVAHLYVRSGSDVAGRPAFNTTLPPLVTAKTPPAFVF